jgi:hypothetical protein
MERVEEVEGPSLFSGLAGVAWSTEQVNRILYPGSREDYNGDTDALLLEFLELLPWKGTFDLCHGLAGFAVHALERMPRPSAARLLLRILDHLEHLAVPQVEGFAWPTGPLQLPAHYRDQSPHGHVDLGAAHGNPGVLAVLAAMDAWGLAPGRTRRLLEGGWAALKHWAASSDRSAGLPAWVPSAAGRSRIAWCYGDLGAAVALLDVDGPMALSFARRAAARPLEASGVLDSGLCHGSAGAAHFFHCLHQRTGDPSCAAAARAYRTLLLDACDPDSPFAGLTAYLPDPLDPPRGRWRTAPGLLEGAAGAGLALLGGPGGTWDRAFLVSLPRPA